MIHKEDWGFRSEWREYVLDRWEPGLGRVQQQKDSQLDAFVEKSHESFSALGFPVKQIKMWVSIQVAAEGDGYDEHYPHVHYPLDGMTLVHYLGGEPAPLDIFQEGEVVETIIPRPGLTVFMPNHIEHGARKHHGSDRIQLIATALRT